MSASEIEDFINGELVSWLESCLPRPEIISGYNSLLDGSILHTVYLQIDPEPQNQPAKINGLDGINLAQTRAKNFDVIIKNLRNLYDEELGQTVLILPDCQILGHNPESHAGLQQMKLLITLLLGAAVQCPNKEIFIARIKELNLETQHAIVEVIKQVTDNQSLVLTQDSIEQLSPETMYHHILRLVKERDHLQSKWISSQMIEVDSLSVAANSKGSLSTNSSMTSVASIPPVQSSENNHMAVELADYKSKLRKLRQELEEKSEAFMEVKEELEHKSNQYEKLRIESQDWYAEARKSFAYRDEVDVLRERAERADRLELEVQKFREKLTDAEFYKTRVDELREDNRMLMETKEMLEDQLARARKRSDHAMVLETEIIKYKQKMNDMTLERDVDKTKLQELMDENIQLQLATKNLISGAEITTNTPSDNEDDPPSNDNSLSEQLTNNAQSRALKLELENRRLLAALDNIKEATFHESSNKILDLEKEKKKLSLKLDQIQDSYNRLAQQNSELENVFKNALEENKKLQDSLEAKQQSIDKQSSDREMDRIKMIDLEKQVESVQKEKQRIQNLYESIQRRSADLERSIEHKSKEISLQTEKLNDFDKLKQQMYDLNAKLASFERENGNLSKDVIKYKESLEDKSVDLDAKLILIEQMGKEIQDLNRRLDEASCVYDKIQEMEKQNQELMSQTKISAETISTLKKDLFDGTLATKKVKQNLERLGLNENDMEKTDINVENIVEKLCKNPETFKTVKEIVLNVGKEMMKSADMCVLCHRQEIFTVEKDIEFSNAEEQNEMDAKLDVLKTENNVLQMANEALQSENARQKVEVSTLGSQISSLNTQHVALQLANSQLAADKDMLVKQIEAKRQQYESLQHDQIALQCLHEQLSSEYDGLNSEKEILRNSIRDLKTENRDLKERERQLEKLIEELKHEIDSTKKETQNLNNLRAEHSKLKDDFRHLFTTSERLKNEYKNIQEQYRNIRSENSRLKLHNTEMTGELNNRIDQMTSLEIEYTKTTQRCDMLLQMNASLDTDRRTLMDHVSQLLSQYHELLAHSLEDKQHYHDEEKNFTDRVNNLARQKEKLEEKIMEHYRKLESCSPKKKPFGSSFVKKVRKAGSELMNRVPNRNRRSWVDDTRLTQSQFTLGSESGGNESDNSVEEPNSVASDTNLLQRNSQIRQSLQRKPNNDAANSVLLRGGVRSSLQSGRREDINASHRNSFQGFDTNTDSLNLGTAGTRRTVYLVDENAIKSEETPNSKSPTPTPPALPPKAAPSEIQSNSNGNNQDPTFLLFNRITIKGETGSTGKQPAPTPPQSEDGKKDKKKTEQKNRESAVWYEYGCV